MANNNEAPAQAPATITPADALYGFAGWLTSRREVTTLGAAEDAAPVAQLLAEYCDAQGLGKCSEEFPHNLKRMPV